MEDGRGHPPRRSCPFGGNQPARPIEWEAWKGNGEDGGARVDGGRGEMVWGDGGRMGALAPLWYLGTSYYATEKKNA